jgi:hypothetical protein
MIDVLYLGGDDCGAADADLDYQVALIECCAGLKKVALTRLQAADADADAEAMDAE